MRNPLKHAGARFVLPVILMTLLSCASAFSMADDRATTEYKIKAAFLYNFSRFVTWPDHDSRADGKFNLCILGNDPFGELLDPLSGKPVQKESLEIKRLTSLEQGHACRIIYVSQENAGDLEAIIWELRDQAILTVSDLEGFTAIGGIIQFKLIDNKIRFYINIDAAKRAGLTISSKLLSLATIVRSSQ